ncbi:hypothetical protein LCGC14_0567380 [marine sediment metagenome]|uniref:Terminase large subunit gp17-like C-terminal domain-containing protein n=1 Tax=marine sediment metagenome TaxID=412755 RepID=A0A0F9U6M2_9ZZZZ
MTLTDLQKKQKTNLERIWKEKKKCTDSPHYFFSKYVFIQDSNNQREVKWGAWPYLLDLIDLFETEREITIGKANQLGISWLACGYGGVWLPLFHANVNSLLLSWKEQGGSQELIRKCNYIINRLPDFLKRPLSSDSKSEIAFSSNDSRVLALASTPKAGAGFNASWVFRDELDLHPYAEANFAFISPTIDSGNAKLVDASTRNPDVARELSHFTQRYIKMRSGAIPGKAVFLGWRERPTRAEGMTQDEWFAERILKRYPAWEIDAHYPETEEDFLAEARKTMFFEKEGVDYIRRDCYDPPETDYDGMVRIWEKPVHGRKYCSFLDPSDGSDPHAAGWLDISTNRLVCVSHGRVKAEKCAEIFDKYNRIYNNSFNEFELTGAAGLKVNQALTDLGTPNRRVTGISRDRKNKYGLWTSDKMRNDLMLPGLDEAIRNKRLRIHYSEIPNELDYMTRKEGEEPKVPRGKNDDLIIMLGGLLQIKRETQAVGQEVNITSGKLMGFE